MANWFLYYWQRFIDDTNNERNILKKLNQNADLMQTVEAGDCVIALANDGYDYVVVAIFPVSSVGENPLGSHDREEYGRYYFTSDKPTYFHPSQRGSAEAAIRASGITVNAKYLGQSFQGPNAFRQITDRAAGQLLKTVNFKI